MRGERTGEERVVDAGQESPEELEEAGWQRRFEADVARVDEVAELYASLGCEVTTRAVAPKSFAPECESCAVASCSRYVEIYTRRRVPAGA